MPHANSDRSAMRSKLARIRVEQDMSQRQLADLSGVSLSTLMRLERKEVANPPLRYLVNLALVLRCGLSDLVEDEWLEWHALGRDEAPMWAPPRLGL